MKLMKFAPALLAGLVLTACSTASDIASSTVNTVSNAANSVADGVSNAATSVKDGVSGAVTTVTNKLNTTTKSVVYQCQHNTLVTAAYAFEGDKAKSVNIVLGKTAITGLMVDEKAPNPVTFASKAYRWNTAEDFSLATFDKSESVILTKLGKNSDQILAKGCKINAAATAQLNK